jgi:hypothetical protein
MSPAAARPAVRGRAGAAIPRDRDLAGFGAARALLSPPAGARVARPNERRET